MTMIKEAVQFPLFSRLQWWKNNNYG